MNREDELIAGYLDDTLTEAERVELEAWLHADNANLLKFVIATVRQEQLRAAVMSRETLFATTRGQMAAPELRSGWPSKLAAVKWILAASLIACLLWSAFPQQKAESGLTLIQTSGQVSLGDVNGSIRRLNTPETFTTGSTVLVDGEGARAKFSYADGSTFSLSGGSELKLSNGDGKQLFLRRGTYLANTSPQPAEEPLIVRTATAEAVVLGTSFGINATASETLLQVSSGAVSLRRLSDNQTTTVTKNEQIRASTAADRPLRAEPISILPFAWRAAPTTGDAAIWLGRWGDAGILRAAPRTVFLKATGVKETHFHAGVRNSYPGLVTLDSNSVVRIRYRIDRPLNLGLFLSTHAASWEFTGNFQAYIEEAKTPVDDEGWRTATVPIGSFYPMGERLAFQPGCVVSTIFATTWDDNAGLEVAELEISSATGDER